MRGSDKSIPIDPAAADLRIEVGADGVFLGFFTRDGQMTLINVEKLAMAGFGDFVALASWSADRRKQAALEIS